MSIIRVYDKLLARYVLHNHIVETVSSDPPGTESETGRLILNTTENSLKFYNGSSWVDPASAVITHNSTTSIQGGTTNEYYHLTSAEYTGLSGLTASQIVSSDGSGNLVSVSDLTTWIAGTSNQITVTDDGDGTLTLNTPQDIDASAAPTFGGLTINGATVLNEGAANSDSRIEGQTDENLIFADASANFVGIGTATPGKKLEISSTGQNQFRLRGQTLSSSAGSIGPLSPTAAVTAVIPGASKGMINLGNLLADDGNTSDHPGGSGLADGAIRNFNIDDLSGVSSIDKLTVTFEAWTSSGTAVVDVYFSPNNQSNWYQQQGGSIVVNTTPTVYTAGNSGWSGAPAFAASHFTNANFLIGFAIGPSAKVDYGTITINYTLGADQVELADFYLGTSGQLILDLTGGTDAAQYFDLRGEDDEYGLILRESDGTGTGVFANFFVTDSAPDYLSININGITNTNALNITSGNDVGIGTATPDAKLQVSGTGHITGNLELDANLNHDGANVGFFGATPVSQPTAYTQTYATANKTHENLTSATLTDSSGGTTDDIVSAVTDNSETTNNTTINDNFAELTEEINALRVDLIDLKQLTNSIIDDLQALGLVA